MELYVKTVDCRDPRPTCQTLLSSSISRICRRENFLMYIHRITMTWFSVQRNEHNAETFLR